MTRPTFLCIGAQKAGTSALHASHIREYNEAGAPWVRFCLHPNQRSQAGAIWCDAPIADWRDVRNSGGKAEPRYVIETELRIGSAAWSIELTLTSRAFYNDVLGEYELRLVVTDARRALKRQPDFFS